VINQSKDNAMETTITLTTGQFMGNVQVSVVNGPDVHAENTVEKPNQVAVRKSTMKISGQSFTYAFEPHSVTALVCSISQLPQGINNNTGKVNSCYLAGEI
jgi:alpha-L-arabinofuranosidase